MRCARSINICEFGRVASTYAEQIDVVRGAPCISITVHHPSCSLRKKQNQVPRRGTSGTAHLYLLTTLLQVPPTPFKFKLREDVANRANRDSRLFFPFARAGSKDKDIDTRAKRRSANGIGQPGSGPRAPSGYAVTGMSYVARVRPPQHGSRSVRVRAAVPRQVGSWHLRRTRTACLSPQRER